MATFLHMPTHISCDSYSDANLSFGTNNITNAFTNTLVTPLLDVKGLQVTRVNLVNTVLQLNDYNGQLMFFFYKTTSSTNAPLSTELFCVRLLPSWYIPAAGFTAFTRNAYFNNGSELAAALTQAASASGDSSTYNTNRANGAVSFSYDNATRKFSMTGLISGFYAPTAADDPNVQAFLATGAVRMNSYNGITVQPYIRGITMNERLGWTTGYFNRGRFASTSVAQFATPTATAVANTVPQEADSWPILIGAQNVNIYCSQGQQGQDSRNKKQLIATIPLEQGALNVCSYSLTSLKQHVIDIGQDIYQLDFQFFDDTGAPFYLSANYNTNIELYVFYKK